MSYPFDKGVDLEHVESTEKISHLDQSHAAHASSILASMPMAPSSAVLDAAVELAEADKVLKPSSAFRVEWWGLIFCLAYLFPAMGQGFDNGAANISV
jgi:hypothetical protein